MSEDVNPQLEQVLEYIKQNRGFDFTAYKRSSLDRRIEKRIQALNLAGYLGIPRRGDHSAHPRPAAVAGHRSRVEYGLRHG